MMSAGAFVFVFEVRGVNVDELIVIERELNVIFESRRLRLR